MARRSDHSRAELKVLVIQATEFIIKNGLEPVTARNIATKIGYTVGTLYNAFKNLDDIILHVNANTLDFLYQVLSSARKQFQADLLPIKAVGLAYVAFSKSETALWQLLFEHRYADETVLPDWYQEKIEKIFQVSESSLKESFPYCEDAIIARVAKTLWSGLHGICILSLGGKLEYVKCQEPLESLADSFMENYLHGLSAQYGSKAEFRVFGQPADMIL